MTNAEGVVLGWCHLFGHNWEQALVGDSWRFRCQRCARVEGHCGLFDLLDGA